MTSQLNRKLFTGAAWMLLTRVLVKSLGLISSIVLARLLVPGDFGLVAIAMSIHAFILLFGSVGFNSVLIQKSDTDDKDFDVVWTIGVVFGFFAAFLFALNAGNIADYFNDVRLKEIIYCVSLLFLINGFVNTGVVKFQKELNFKRELKFQLIPKIISFISTLTMAFVLQNYWALVFGMLIHQLMITITSYMMSDYKPQFRVSGIGKLFNFSKWIMLNQLFYYLNNRSMDLIVGRLISTRATGIYSISLEIASMPVTEVVAPINKSAFPVYSKAQKDLEKIRELFLQTITLIGAISLPAVIGLFFVVDIFVPVVLGEKWIEAITIIQFISISSLFLGLSSNAGYLLIALGKPHLSTLNGFIRTVLLISSAIIMIKSYGLPGAAMGMILSSIIGFIIAYGFAAYYAKISFFRILSVFIRPLLSGAVMGCALVLVKQLDYISVDLISLIITVVVGGIVYCTALLILWLIAGKPQGIESYIVQKFNGVLAAQRPE
jgi:O-antigen/teichoic acid export membrane protein